jgi:hypothetical protein
MCAILCQLPQTVHTGWEVPFKKRPRVSLCEATLKQSQGIADAVGCSSSKLRWVEQRVDRDDLLY